jgi:cell division protein FtsX
MKDLLKQKNNLVQDAFITFTDEKMSWLKREEQAKDLLNELKKEQQLLQADRPMIDYFLVLKENYSHEPATLIEKLRTINGIVAVFSFNSQEFDILDYLTS